MNIKEQDVLRMFLARSDNYGVTGIQHVRGRFYSVEMNGEHYNAVVLISSFHYYELRYHLAQQKPTLIICYQHDTVCPVPVLSMRAGNLAQAYELPEGVNDIGQQRHSKTGTQVLLGMYISGMRQAQAIIQELPDSTRSRYLARVKALGQRKRGKPVGLAVVK